MPEYREVRNERFYLKEPGTERLRKTASGRLRHLLATGWREVERWYSPQYVTVRMERSGHPPLAARLPKVEARRGRGGQAGAGSRSSGRSRGRRGGPAGPGA
ncbi:MAG TPA: hypothetical protein VNO34_01840 [Actinomycetota bacterium]|nr:hypothetical protein [Actinomycetota bacterium]